MKMDATSILSYSPYPPRQFLFVKATVYLVIAILFKAADHARALDDSRPIGAVEKKQSKSELHWICLIVGILKNAALAFPLLQSDGCPFHQLNEILRVVQYGVPERPNC